MTIWFTSDLHLGHANIIKYCRRPFASVDEMDYALVQNWRERVRDGDTIYVLGDVSFHRRERTKELLRGLPGNKILLPGNHDGAWLLTTGLWQAVLPRLSTLSLPNLNPRPGSDSLIVRVDHYPPDHIKVATRTAYRTAYYLHGHSHGTKACTIPGVYDVGVDANDYAPVAWETIFKKLRESHK